MARDPAPLTGGSATTLRHMPVDDWVTGTRDFRDTVAASCAERRRGALADRPRPRAALAAGATA
ncbi:hypothetical protein EBN88_25460 [Streptomyces triticirhizae]|uniref:Uncharacterized protein n=1 Tax=Streptomyces triticirhizae TaxID=2483353 RepID=A0A3M2L7Y8_9ACTN|nr:hypothetical protein EBN88_25460 [Streptomyces triticirhizae]